MTTTEKQLLLCSLILISLGFFVYAYKLDRSLFYIFNSIMPFGSVWQNITELGAVFVSGSLAYLIFRNDKYSLFAGLIAGLLTHLTSHYLKRFFHILRPEHQLDSTSILLLGPPLEPSNFSMPSGHSMTVFMILGLAILFNRWQKRVIVVSGVTLAVLIAFSRIAVGAHWPSDCLIGAGLGLVIAAITHRLTFLLSGSWLNYAGAIYCLVAGYSVFMLLAVYRGMIYWHSSWASGLIFTFAGATGLFFLLRDLFHMQNRAT